MHLKHRNSRPPDISALDALNDYTWKRHLSEKCVLSELYIKQIKNIMTYQLYPNASKNNK